MHLGASVAREGVAVPFLKTAARLAACWCPWSPSWGEAEPLCSLQTLMRMVKKGWHRNASGSGPRGTPPLHSYPCPNPVCSLLPSLGCSGIFSGPLQVLAGLLFSVILGFGDQVCTPPSPPWVTSHLALQVFFPDGQQPVFPGQTIF